MSGWLHSTQGPQAHLVLELLAYFVGARVYWAAARQQPLPPHLADRLLLLASAIFGAALGSKLLHVLEHLPYLLEQNDRALWLGGKSVLGGFLGGTVAVEIAKRFLRWPLSTGDAWVPALAVGLMIGRLGCQLSGTWDQTYGIATDLPWAWDYGDGMARHPTGLYEIAAVGLLWAAVRQWQRKRWQAMPGAGFAAFMLGYCMLRLGLDFLKPPFGPIALPSLPVAQYAGLSAIQWAACGGMLGFGGLLRWRLNRSAKL